MQFAGRHGVVFGATRGIRRALALRLAERGATLTLPYSPTVDGSSGPAAEVVAEIERRGGKARICVADVRNADEVDDALERAGGALDFAVNCAAETLSRPLAECSLEDFDRLFATNCRGTFIVMRAAARRLADGGRLVVFTSPAARRSGAGGALYGGTKASIEAFVRSLAWELAGRRITVNAIAPGLTDTPMLLEAFRERGPALSPFGRIGQPDDVARVALLLLSDDAGWLTGQTIFATGGAVMD